jgi:hypothetical protein
MHLRTLYALQIVPDKFRNFAKGYWCFLSNRQAALTHTLSGARSYIDMNGPLPNVESLEVGAGQAVIGCLGSGSTHRQISLGRDLLICPSCCRTILAMLDGWFWDQRPVVNFVRERICVASQGGALMPYDRSVDPIVWTRGIGTGFLATDRRFRQAFFAVVHYVHVRLGANQAAVKALSMMYCWTLLHAGQPNVRRSFSISPGSIAVSFIGDPQTVHCGPWFCLSSMALVSIRRSELSEQPTDCRRFEGIGSNDADLDLIAPGTFEQPVLETDGSRWNTFQHHPRLAAGTARALNGGQKLLGGGHDASLHWAGALPDSQSPMMPMAGGDELILLPDTADQVVNIAQSRKYNKSDHPTPATCGPSLPQYPAS